MLLVMCICRLHWEDLSGKLGDAFDVEAMLGRQSDELLRKARSLHPAENTTNDNGNENIDKVFGCVFVLYAAFPFPLLCIRLSCCVPSSGQSRL